MFDTYSCEMSVEIMFNSLEMCYTLLSGGRYGPAKDITIELYVLNRTLRNSWRKIVSVTDNMIERMYKEFNKIPRPLRVDFFLDHCLFHIYIYVCVCVCIYIYVYILFMVSSYLSQSCSQQIKDKQIITFVSVCQKFKNHSAK